MYQLIDSGHTLKLEQFGTYRLIRPCAQALWSPSDPSAWHQVDAVFTREQGWRYRCSMPSSWMMKWEQMQFKISLTDFGHLGLFPEHAQLWTRMAAHLRSGTRLLNLFAYSGAATLAAAQRGGSVCHVDAAEGMVRWARENAALNHLEHAPIRWIVDDVIKFLKREEKRTSLYDAILLDPPTFGRGKRGEVFKIERDLCPLLHLCKNVLSDHPQFLMLSCHTPGLTPLVLQQLMRQLFPETNVEMGELVLTSQQGGSIPSGCYAICWFSS
jgi:23S rRNA (cytosine1962-C5)-methyltransferase